MSWLFEDPTYVWMLGGAVIIGLLITLKMTGRVVFLYAIGAVAAVIGLLTLIAWLVVTERERVEATIVAGVAAVESNDPLRVLQFIDPKADRTRSRVQTVMKHYRMKWVSIGRDEEVDVDMKSEPPSAVASFFVRAEIIDSGAQGAEMPVVGRVTLFMQKSGDTWLVERYSISAPR